MADVVVEEGKVKEAAEDYETVTKIEAAVDEWCRQISSLIEQVGAASLRQSKWLRRAP
jgi:hypothetical protein